MIFHSLFLLLSIYPLMVISCASTSSSASPIIATTVATVTTTSAPLVCATCTNIEVLPSDLGTNIPPVQTAGVDANGCATLTVTCTAPDAATDIFFFWYEDGNDRGISQSTGMVTETLTCNDMGQLELTGVNGDVGIVDQVECITA